MKKLLKYSVLFLLLIQLSSCLKYEEVKMVKVVNVEMKNVSPKGMDIDVAMQIDNPNTYAISIVDSDLQFFVEGKKVGVATIKDNVKLNKKSNEVYHFTIQSKFGNIGAEALPLAMSLLSKSSIKVQLKGDVKAKAKGIGKRFPVDFTENVKL